MARWVWAWVAAVALIGACASEGGTGASPWEELKRYVRNAGPEPHWPKPVSNDRLREIARARGFGSPSAPVFNGNVGRAFQRWALEAFPGGRLVENSRNLASAVRRQATGARPAGPILAVRPDAVGEAATVIWERLLGVPRPRLVPAPDSVLVEVKAVRGALVLSTSSYQVAGLIDVAANAPVAHMAGAEEPTPAVVFVTTLDTIVSPTVLEEASRRGVAIWQARVFELPESTPTNPRLCIGQVVPLNPELYAPSMPEPLMPGPTDVPFPLREVQPPAVPFDPDPPEVR